MERRGLVLGCRQRTISGEFKVLQGAEAILGQLLGMTPSEVSFPTLYPYTLDKIDSVLHDDSKAENEEGYSSDDH
jgi:hypothetical protein